MEDDISDLVRSRIVILAKQKTNGEKELNSEKKMSTYSLSKCYRSL